MKELDIIKTLSKTRKPRTPLYLNSKNINYFFSQKLGGLTSLVRSERLGADVSASLLTIISSKVSGETGVQEVIELSPILKAILLEAQANEDGNIVDLSKEESNPDSWLTYIGRGEFISWDKDVSSNTVDLDNTTVKTIQKERDSQEGLLKFWDNTIRTFVWLADNKDKTFCSIISTKWIISHTFASLINQPTQGIFGRYEKIINGVVFIAPMWIWNEG